MKYCVRCLYPANHPLNITFDDEGVCSGCRVHEEKDRLDWRVRTKKLEGILASFRSETAQTYDCVVPVSGARDSYFIVHTVKKVFGMNPLLVSYNRHFNTERGIRNLAYLRTLFDCDHVQMVVQPQKVKKITRETVRRIGSMYWHVLAGQTVFPVQTAVRYKIPLIVWGAHQGVDQVGMFSHLDEVEMTRKYRLEHDLMGWEAEDLLGAGDGKGGVETLTGDDMKPFCYPHDREIAKVGVRGIYLNNYIRWDTKAQHEAMIDAYGYETAAQARTFDAYNDVDCQHYSGLHDHVKFMKWGYGKVSDHASREIRLRRMTREDGIAMVKRYRDVVPTDQQKHLDWIGMETAEFQAAIDRFRDPAIWRRAGGRWTPLDSVINHAADRGVDQARLRTVEDCRFRITPSKDPGADEGRYKLLAKGFVDGAGRRT